MSVGQDDGDRPGFAAMKRVEQLLIRHGFMYTDDFPRASILSDHLVRFRPDPCTRVTVSTNSALVWLTVWLQSPGLCTHVLAAADQHDHLGMDVQDTTASTDRLRVWADKREADGYTCTTTQHQLTSRVSVTARRVRRPSLAAIAHLMVKADVLQARGKTAGEAIALWLAGKPMGHLAPSVETS